MARFTLPARAARRLALPSLLAVLAAPATASADNGAAVWAQAGCGSCHTLAAAGSSGQAGPDLDQLRPSAARVALQITDGGAAMPSFAGALSGAQIDALASWVASVAGGGSGGPPEAVAVAGAASVGSGGVLSGLTAAGVRALQTDLARLGYFHHVVTGYYGRVTTAAVKAFQRAAGLTPDGIWGPKSAAALRRRLG